MFQVDHKKGLTLTEVAEGVSVEDVSSCTDEQTKKLTTVHFGTVFDIKCSRAAAYRALTAFARVQLRVLCLHYDAGLCVRSLVPTIYRITCFC